jgi:hypothetical protein
MPVLDRKLQRPHGGKFVCVGCDIDLARSDQSLDLGDISAPTCLQEMRVEGLSHFVVAHQAIDVLNAREMFFYDCGNPLVRLRRCDASS